VASEPPRRLIVGISGASGVIYGVRTLQALRGSGIETHLVMSRSAEMTIGYETDMKPKEVRALAAIDHPARRSPRAPFKRWACSSCHARSAP